MPPDVNSANCPHCKGAQWVYQTDGELLVPVRCQCLERKLLHDFLGPEISRAKHIEHSELYHPTPNEAGEIEGDRTEENLFIKGPWSIVCQHLRWSLAGKRLYSNGFTYRIVSDVDVLDVWLGNKSYKQTSAEVRNEVETHNALSDLLADPTLVIIRLGVRASKNRVAASVLHEALSIRTFLYKPTWLVEGDVFFGDGHPFYNSDVEAYVNGHFDVVDLGNAKTAKQTQDALKALSETRQAVFEEGSVGMGVEVETPDLDRLPTTKEAFKPRHKSSNRGSYKPGRRGNRDGGGLPEF